MRAASLARTLPDVQPPGLMSNCLLQHLLLCLTLHALMQFTQCLKPFLLLYRSADPPANQQEDVSRLQ